MDDFTAQRERMVARQIEARGIGDRGLLAAFRAVPREYFVAAQFTGHAYDDRPLPIEAEQTISQPYIVALMVQAAAIGPDDRVLEVGAGSGYAAAVVGQIAATVVAIERHHQLAELAATRMKQLGYDNVQIVEGDGSRGCPGKAPFDAILVAAAASEVPPALIDQLKPGGRLVMPVGGQLWSQALVKLTKQDDGTIARESLCGVRFVPLISDEAAANVGG